MLVNRSVGLVLPTSSKWLVDEVIGKQNGALIPWIAMAAAGATVIQAATTFTL